MNIKEITIKILPLLKKAGVTKSEIFGSYARGDQRADSDIDLLVEVPESTSLIDFAGFKLELEEHLGMKVDLVAYDAINHRIKSYIEKDTVQIL